MPAVAGSLSVHSHPVVTPELTAEWDDLVDRAGATPFHRPGWFTAWWDAFGAGSRRVVTVRRGEALVAVMPLVERRGVVSSPTNWHSFVSGPVAVDDAARTLLLEHVLASGRRVELSHLTTPVSESTTDTLTRRGAHVRGEIVQRSPYVPGDVTFESYVDRREARRVRQLQRNRRKLEKLGPVRYVADGGDLDAAVARFLEIEASGWKGESGTAILSDARTRAFYAGLAAWAGAAGLLRVAFLELDGRAIAGELCLEDEYATYPLKASYEPDHRPYSPGLILLFEQIRTSVESGRSYEFMGSAEPYKMRWADDVRDIHRLDVHPATLPGRATLLADLGVRTARRGAGLGKRVATDARDRARALLARRASARRGGVAEPTALPAQRDAVEATAVVRPPQFASKADRNAASARSGSPAAQPSRATTPS
ncbi:MAG: GNAT family N-acetyltransferase [Pseudonocardia sp.]|uniref:GNAT family N-acetyltransferase n=1 Tax=unclassified Pseudonocardia TaxID=2619320 RepID=UPI001AD0A0B4|nr:MULTISPECIES: GNAT family N-acetyltransferase [unclassified Pseudonocardia]MBN9110653.1 GNAT family N-acetyltransferase [Pseudonocardia sp.]